MSGAMGVLCHVGDSVTSAVRWRIFLLSWSSTDKKLPVPWGIFLLKKLAKSDDI